MATTVEAGGSPQDDAFRDDLRVRGRMDLPRLIVALAGGKCDT